MKNKRTVATLAQMKANGEKISQVTCYDYTTAKLVEASGIDMILVTYGQGNDEAYSDFYPLKHIDNAKEILEF